MTVVCIKCRRRYQLAEGQSLTGCACECGGKLYAEDDPILYQEQPEPQPSGDGKVIACPDCGGKVSRRAPACPHCGAPLRTPNVRVTDIDLTLWSMAKLILCFSVTMLLLGAVVWFAVYVIMMKR